MPYRFRILAQDTDGTKSRPLEEGELGYDAYAAGGDEGRVSVGTASGTDVLLAKKDEHYTKTEVDNGFVDKTTIQTINGIKTFGVSPIIPDATADVQAVNKGQLDLKADKATTYTIAESDNKFADKLTTYTKTEADDLLANKSDLNEENTFTQTNTFTGKVTIGDKTFNDPNIYSLGIKGEIGFGVATAPRNMMNKAGCIGLDGHDVIGSKGYGNYLHLKSGAILVYIPKHYYKLTINTPDFSDTAEVGYVLDRSFINGGIELDGIFVGKYGATNNNGILSSQSGQDPLSTNSSHNPISNLDGTPINNLGGMYAAVKTMDSNAVVTPNWVYSMLARIALAQGQSATNTTACAYIDVNPKMPKGNLNNALSDYDDPSVTFTSSGYSNCALTGSGSNFAKTTHNGQENGITDLNGNMWEIASGFIRTDVDGFLMLKESVDIRDIVDDNSVDATGAYFVGNYDVVDLSDVVFDNSDLTYLGNGVNQVFPMSTDRNSISYKKNALGIPNADGHSASGTTEFGNDGVFRYLTNEMVARRGGYWGDSSYAGVGCINMANTRLGGSPIVRSSTGGRACIIV